MGASTSAAHVRLRWWSASQLETVAQRLHEPWARWTRRWLAPAGAARARVSCANAFDHPQEASRHWSSAGPGAWMAQQAGLFSLLFGVVPSTGKSASELARALSRRAWQDWQSIMAEVLQPGEGPAADDLHSSLFRRWSGAVLVSLDGGHGTVAQVLLEGACVQRWIPRDPAQRRARATLTPLHEACATHPVRACARLHACDLDLGTLASLAIGDVIPLPHALDAPLEITMDESALCAAWLGRSGARKAVELAALPENS
jgi:hypothetical protein